ncbi:hypothetical protein BH11CYA1_BH11CYA1_32170 [soil metagenome]
MPYAPEFSEATAKTISSDQSAVSSNLLKEVQNYQDHKHQKNSKDDSQSLNGDDAVKKMFNGKEVHKMLKDFVINEDQSHCFEPKGPKNLQELLPKPEMKDGEIKKGNKDIEIDTKDLKFLRK